MKNIHQGSKAMKLYEYLKELGFTVVYKRLLDGIEHVSFNEFDSAPRFEFKDDKPICLEATERCTEFVKGEG